MWSAVKSKLTTPPFNYQVQLLGTIDMVVLFTLAISMNIFGPSIEKWGAKNCLIIAMSGLVVFNTLIGVFLNLGLTSEWIYVVFFGLGVGVSSSLGWPSCLCVRVH
jgi:MFS family permease